MSAINNFQTLGQSISELLADEQPPGQLRSSEPGLLEQEHRIVHRLIQIYTVNGDDGVE